MQNLRSRLSKLEKHAGISADPGLLVVVSASSEEEVADILVRNGIDAENPNHMIVHLQRFIVDPDGSREPYRHRPEITISDCLRR